MNTMSSSFDPTGFYLHKYLPRVAAALRGLRSLPSLPGLHYFRLVSGMRGLRQTRGQDSPSNATSSRPREEAERFFQHNLAFNARMAALGYPLSNGGNAVSPYDFIADYFRGATGMMKDLYRNKDKLLRGARQGARLPDPSDHRRAPRPRPPDRDDSDPLGAGRLHVAQAVRDLLVAVRSAR